eukprot:795512-Prorocentrum_lima.AAC.1
MQRDNTKTTLISAFILKLCILMYPLPAVVVDPPSLPHPVVVECEHPCSKHSKQPVSDAAFVHTCQGS